MIFNLNKFNDVLAKATGLRFTKVNPCPDLRHVAEDPREGFYLVNTLPFVMELNVDAARHWRWFSLGGYSTSPFFVATDRFLKDRNNRRDISKIYETINDYARLCCPKNAIEALGIRQLDCNFTEAMHPQYISLPWNYQTPFDCFNAWRSNTISENRIHGVNSDDYLGSPDCSHEKINIEVKRLHQLIISIERQGFISTQENLFGAIVLVHEDDEFCWYIRGGQHRSAILAALGWKKLPVKIIKIVYRREVEYWPGVISGFYSIEAALMVFDRIFNAETPPYCNDWVQRVKSYND